jgi:hypothetical protein
MCVYRNRSNVLTNSSKRPFELLIHCYFLTYFVLILFFFRKIIFVDTKMNIIICLLMFSFFLIVAGRNLQSLSSPDVNYDAQPVQSTLPLPPPNVNCDAPPVQPTLHPPPPNVNFDAPPVESTLPPPSPSVFDDLIWGWGWEWIPFFSSGWMPNYDCLSNNEMHTM